MSYLDKAMDLALFIIIFSAALSLLNSPAIGVGESLGVQKEVDAGPDQGTLEDKVTEQRDLTPMPGVDYFFRMILAGWDLMKIIIGIPFAIYNVITTLVPGPAGQAIGVFIQAPANLIMAMGLAKFFQR